MKKMFILALLVSGVAWGAKHAPLLPPAVSAKTVYIVNQTGVQGVTDGAYQAFQKWGRIQVVQNKKSANLIVVFSRSKTFVNGNSLPVLTMLVYAPDSSDALYQVTPRSTPETLFHTWQGVAETCVRDFQKRLKESHQ